MTPKDFHNALTRGVTDFHCGPCTRTIGPKGGIQKESVENWRTNGQLKTWVTRPNEFRQPIKHGLRHYGYLDHTNVNQFHPADACTPEDIHVAAKNTRLSNPWYGPKDAPVKLTKSLLVSFDPYGHNPHVWTGCGWYTNGHWMVRHSHVRLTKQARDMFTPNLTEAHVAPQLAKAAHAHIVINVDTSDEIHAIYRAKLKSIVIAFDVRYARLFDFPTLYSSGDPAGACFAKDSDGSVWATIMPRRI
jgi:hypothetical protein